jgi:hypothetical protein
MPLGTADKAMNCSAAQASPWFFDADPWYDIHPWVFLWRYWLTYSGCQRIYVQPYRYFQALEGIGRSKIPLMLTTCHDVVSVSFVKQVKLYNSFLIFSYFWKPTDITCLPGRERPCLIFHVVYVNKIPQRRHRTLTSPKVLWSWTKPTHTFWV